MSDREQDAPEAAEHEPEGERADGVVVATLANPITKAKEWAPKGAHVRVEIERTFEFGYMTQDAPESDWDDWYRCEVAALTQHAAKVATSLACSRNDDSTIRLMIVLDVPTLDRAKKRCVK